MAGKQEMPRVDMSKEFPNLTSADQHFVRKIESLNKVRAGGKKTMRGRNRITGALLGIGVVGIYFYTINAVKQEKFLDDFEDLTPATATAPKS